MSPGYAFAAAFFLPALFALAAGFFVFAAGLALPVWAETWVIAPGEGPPQDKLDRAADGDVVRFGAGEHRGPIRITRKVTVEGDKGAILVGSGQGSVVTVSAPGAIVRGLTVRGSGKDLEAMDAGVFVEKTAAGDADFATCVENIDIGGPAMIRAGAKNHDAVTVVVDPADYAEVLAEMDANEGGTTLELRKALATRAYARTAQYDAAISAWFAGALGDETPRNLTIAGRLADKLRYGENPHQWAAFYRTNERRPGVATATQVQGKELSYNNLNDTDAAYELVAEFDPKSAAAVAIIKHANPCGVATANTLAEAYAKALACDPVSAFGGNAGAPASPTTARP